MIHERFNHWKELKSLCDEDKEKLVAMSEEEMADSFYQELAFGTAGSVSYTHLTLPTNREV